MMIMKTALFFAALVVADASTTVAVLEFGKSGVVRRTTSKKCHTTVAGVGSFFNAMSNKGMQQADMTVVPDLFRRADGAVVIGISGAGVDLESMPTISNLVQSEGNNVVGHMTLAGAHGRDLLNKAGPSKELDAKSLVAGVKSEAASKNLSSVSVQVDSENVAAVDTQIAAMLVALQKQAGADSTIIVHLVVEEEEGASRRRLMSRRLEDENGDEEEDNNEDAENENNNNANNGYYGYGYYQNGVWVTPYKTMFQIQYFNMVLWTSVGLTVVLFYTIYQMMDMPLEADTLLFGESAKIGD